MPAGVIVVVEEKRLDRSFDHRLLITSSSSSSSFLSSFRPPSSRRPFGGGNCRVNILSHPAGDNSILCNDSITAFFLPPFFSGYPKTDTRDNHSSPFFLPSLPARRSAYVDPHAVRTVLCTSVHSLAAFYLNCRLDNVTFTLIFFPFSFTLLLSCFSDLLSSVSCESPHECGLCCLTHIVVIKERERESQILFLSFRLRSGSHLLALLPGNLIGMTISVSALPSHPSFPAGVRLLSLV